MDQKMLDVLDGINVTPEHSIVEDDETRDGLIALISDAKEIGCKPALEKHSHNLGYLTDPRRSKYIDLADIQADHHVLEIGSSMGQHTRLMAQKCKAISGLEIVPLQAAFSKLWCEEDGLNNVDITSGGANGVLPFEDASFDRVVCNYVLEWCAGRNDMDPGDFHRAYIAEMFRVLKPGGKLLLTTKNRYSIRYVTGGKDEHLGMRFGNALPRWLQERMLNSDNLDFTRGYLHSWAQLEDILRGVGFAEATRFLTFPDNRYAYYAGSFEGFSADDLPQEAMAGLTKKERLSLKLPAALFQQTTNSLVFLADKPGA
jgi:SAM-dependent methyltransferase